MDWGSIIESLLESNIPGYAHTIVGNTNVSLGGEQMLSNTTFTRSYNFVAPLCAVMGVFCVALMVFVAVCIWMERTYEVPEDNKDRARKSREGQSEDDVDDEEQGRRGRGRRRRRSRCRGGNYMGGSTAGESEMVQRPQRRACPPEQQQSALFNMDPSFYKKTSSAAPSFRKPPGSITDPGTHANPARELPTMRRRSSQPNSECLQSLDSSFASPPTVVAEVSPLNPQHPHIRQQQQQQLSLAAVAGNGGSLYNNSGSNGTQLSTKNYSNHFGGDPGQNAYHAAPPTHGRPGQLPPLPATPSMTASSTPPKQHDAYGTSGEAQQEGDPASSVNPLASTRSSSRAPSVRRQGARNNPSNYHTHPAPQEAGVAQLPPPQRPLPADPQQQQKPTFDYANIYGGYAQAGAPSYPVATYVNPYSYPPAGAGPDPGANLYAYSQNYAQNTGLGSAFPQQYGDV